MARSTKMSWAPPRRTAGPQRAFGAMRQEQRTCRVDSSLWRLGTSFEPKFNSRRRVRELVAAARLPAEEVDVDAAVAEDAGKMLFHRGRDVRAPAEGHRE